MLWGLVSFATINNSKPLVAALPFFWFSEEIYNYAQKTSKIVSANIYSWRQEC
jgi:hypothetical protein